ncbi:MAG: Flp family type IVb pilin [Phycisphaerales bacterium]|nr:MAG: Flp family type IVb pilin [Phycisphaerales bacterium]
MSTLAQKLTAFLRSEDGPTTVEYATLLALILLVSISILSTFGDSVSGIYESIAAAAGG